MTLSGTLLREFHPFKNGTISASQITDKSGKNIWWRCEEYGHEWQQKPIDRSRSANPRCIYCSGKRILVEFNDLLTTDPSVAKEWDYEKNLRVPQDYSRGSGYEAWWKCSNQHSYKLRISHRTHGFGCPYCSGKKAIPGETDLVTLYPQVAQEIHPTKNPGIVAAELLPNDGARLVWLCRAGHEWQQTVFSRRKGKSGCPVCSNKIIISGINDLATVNPSLAAEWHPILNGNLTPEQVAPKSGKLVYWLCSKGHEWKSTILNRANGNGCPSCSGLSVIEGETDLKTLFPGLITTSVIALNPTIDFSKIGKGSHVQVRWDCELGHYWKAAVYHRTKGRGCPRCAKGQQVSKAEKEIASTLKPYFPKLRTSDNEILANNYELDIYIPEKNLAIEYNGIYWHSEDKGKGQLYHYDKWKQCYIKGINLIHVWEDDWTSKPDVILDHLKLVTQIKMDLNNLNNLKVIGINTTIGSEFLEEHHIQGKATGSQYLGLRNENGNLIAVMLIQIEENNSIEIIRYATITNYSEAFKTLLGFVKEKFNPTFITAITNHSLGEESLYESYGFISKEKIEPDYMYTSGTFRFPKEDYTLERFKKDPSLIWKRGLSVNELASLNKLYRIWDAGKTQWILENK